jgi:hypothetical protein
MLISRLFHVRDGLTSATDSTLELQFIVSLCFRRSPQGAPALPHLQPCSPSQGVSGSFSHTQPQSVIRICGPREHRQNEPPGSTHSNGYFRCII